MALYRKYRPATFAEVVGQEHVTDPLCTALDTGRISHAYLFSGPRGCGKTSSARILARSLNCVEGPTSTPCGTCASCASLAPGGGGNLDVIELDAASHGGVDDTRELRDRAFYAPAESRYRVFIVDEAHMVTTAGFNALLKIVEEPPAHLIFVFATTEPEKVLPTIRSRTHHYPFRLLPPATMRGLLGDICAQEHVPVDEAVYPLVIRAGGGSPRDSLSVLDQLLAGAGSDGVTYTRAVALLGVTDVALIDDAIDALSAGDGAALFRTVDRVMEAGHDPRRFAVDLLERLRDLILMQAVPDATERGLVAAPADLLDRMRDQAARLGPATLTRCAELLHAGLGEMRGATAPRLLLEVVCSRMVLPAADTSDAATLQRLERLERQVASGVVSAPAAGAAEPGQASAGAPPEPAGRAADPARRRGAEALAALRGSKTASTPGGSAGDTPQVAHTTDSAPRSAESDPRNKAAEGSADATVAPAGGGSDRAPAAGPDNASSADTRQVTGADNGARRPVETGADERAGAQAAPGGQDRAKTGAGEQDPAGAQGSADDRDRPAGEEAGADRVGPQAAPGTRDRANADTAEADRAGAQASGDVHDQERATGSGADRSGADQGDTRRPDIESTAPAEPAGAHTDAELLAAVEAAWAEIKVKVRDFGPTIGAMLTSGASVAGVEQGEIVLAHHAALVQRLSQPQSVGAVRSAVAAVLGHEYPVRWVVAGQQVSRGPGGRERGGRRSGDADSGDSEGGRRGGPHRTRTGRPGAGDSESAQGETATGRVAEAAGAAGTVQTVAGSGEPNRAAGASGKPALRFSRPSQARGAAAAGEPGAAGPGNSGRGGAGNPDDDIPPPDFPDLPDDPGPDDYGYGSGVVAPSTPEEEREMLADAARPVDPGQRRDPDEVALQLLASELGATPLNG
ncbi:DNA polymerase III subunit gamma and tau [Nocardia speluncae]|uniref:DNA polymerase III subunit gamma and tau n=2 Tax=Nocardia speluncae TaxID=419477 RepID=UPI00289FD262|nr:DNA polymerase III subunit gamma and tau [Nocardia speluncae]